MHDYVSLLLFRKRVVWYIDAAGPKRFTEFRTGNFLCEMAYLYENEMGKGFGAGNFLPKAAFPPILGYGGAVPLALVGRASC